MSNIEKLEMIFSLLIDQVKKNKTLKNKIEQILKESDVNVNLNDTEKINITEITSRNVSDSTTRTNSYFVEQPRKNRRNPAVLDPVKLIEEDKEILRFKLAELDMEKLRDIIAEYGMDPAKLVIKWKNKERVIQHILSIAESRSKKGDAFR